MNPATLVVAAAWSEPSVCEPCPAAEIEPVDVEGMVKRHPLSRIIAGQTIGVGKVAPQRQGSGISLGRPRERRDRLGRIAAAKRGKALVVGPLRKRYLVHAARLTKCVDARQEGVADKPRSS